ncbi:flippase [Patescibacteria group bacterium]|nr:flippase [Patescibacteria group bacterium]
MLARKIALNTIVSALARIVGTALALVTIGLATRYLTKTEWGEYSLVLTFGGIFAVLAEWGLYQLMVREISKEGADEEKIASNLFTLRLIISLFIFVLAPLISLLFPYSNQARMAILIGMAGFWLLSGTQVLMGVFQKYLRMDKVGLAEVVGRAIQLALVFLFIKINLGLLWIVFALALSSLANFILVFLFARQYVRVRLAFDISFWKKSFVQSFPLAISNILVMIYFSTDSLFLSVFKPVTDVGIYRLPYKILESLIFFPAMFVGLIMPLLSRFANSNWPQFKNVFQRAFDVIVVFTIPLVAGTLVLSPRIIDLLGGGRYPESAGVLNVLIVAVGAVFLGTLFSFALIAAEKQRTLLKISLAGAVVNVVLNLVLIPRYSYMAAAATTVLTEALVAFLMMAAIYRSLRFWPSSRAVFKSLLAAGAMAIALFYLRFLNLFILMALALLIYFGLLYLIRGFSSRDISELIKKDEV